MPTWIFRGFTNEGPDDGILLTVLGQDVTGGIIWGPSVLKEAESYGLHLTADNRLIDTVAGDVVPEDVPLIKPMQQPYIDELTTYTAEEMRERVTQPGDREYSRDAFLCTGLPGGNAELAGHRVRHERRTARRAAAARAALTSTSPGCGPQLGEGMLRHRHHETQVLIGKSGRWRVTLNDGDERDRELGPQDTLSVPAGSWRSFDASRRALGLRPSGHRGAARGQQRRWSGPAGVGPAEVERGPRGGLGDRPQRLSRPGVGHGNRDRRRLITPSGWRPAKSPSTSTTQGDATSGSGRPYGKQSAREPSWSCCPNSPRQAPASGPRPRHQQRRSLSTADSSDG